jgi:hypothetical protein
MKLSLPIAFVFILMACKKEKELPHLTFSSEEKQWLIYQTGQQFKFKNDKGDSLVYTVTGVSHNSHTSEYKDTNFTVEAYTESYLATLVADNDSIVIYFYKAWQSNTEPNKLKQFIRWLRVKNQHVKLTAIVYNTPFASRVVNGITYNTVTEALPGTDTVYPFTQFDKAYYDQRSGIIEIIDLNGVSWKRV